MVLPKTCKNNDPNHAPLVSIKFTLIAKLIYFQCPKTGLLLKAEYTFV